MAASIIASQALISGSFTLINEAISLNFWPKVTVKFPTDVRGQIYIPSINWILCTGCFLVVLYFRTSEAMTAAYGFSITVAMLMTTVLMYYFLRYVKHYPSGWWAPSSPSLWRWKRPSSLPMPSRSSNGFSSWYSRSG
jgi:KUP system potassium uptake protein